MEAKELRIGNYVDFIGISKILELHSQEKQFDNVYLECEESFEWTEYNKLQPIPLSEEILLKCGFTFIPQGDEVYQQIFTYNGFDIWMHDDGFCHDYLHGGDINHLHQLQNLYFALTNEELTVNL